MTTPRRLRKDIQARPSSKPTPQAAAPSGPDPDPEKPRWRITTQWWVFAAVCALLVGLGIAAAFGDDSVSTGTTTTPDTYQCGKARGAIGDIATSMRDFGNGAALPSDLVDDLATAKGTIDGAVQYVQDSTLSAAMAAVATDMGQVRVDLVSGADAQVAASTLTIDIDLLDEQCKAIGG